MSVYLFTSYNIVNEQAYAPYVEGSLPILHKYGGEILAADDQALVMDGEPRDINVILKFPSVEAAMQMTQCAEYQPWLKLRLANTDNRVSVLMNHFELPDN